MSVNSDCVVDYTHEMKLNKHERKSDIANLSLFNLCRSLERQEIFGVVPPFQQD